MLGWGLPQIATKLKRVTLVSKLAALHGCICWVCHRLKVLQASLPIPCFQTVLMLNLPEQCFCIENDHDMMSLSGCHYRLTTSYYTVCCARKSSMGCGLCTRNRTHSNKGFRNPIIGLSLSILGTIMGLIIVVMHIMVCRARRLFDTVQSGQYLQICVCASCIAWGFVLYIVMTVPMRLSQPSA